MFKSETGKDPIISFVGLQAKMYSFVTESDHKEHMKAKGVFPREQWDSYTMRTMCSASRKGVQT